MGFLAGWNGLAASPPSLRPIWLPSPALEVVVYDEVFAVGPVGLQRVEAEGDADEPARPGQGRVDPAEGHAADHLDDSHGCSLSWSKEANSAGHPRRDSRNSWRMWRISKNVRPGISTARRFAAMVNVARAA